MNGGQKLGLWAGGVIENTPSYSPAPHDGMRNYGMSSFLLLNEYGERFVDESIPYALSYAMYRQPRGKISSVTDAKWLEQIKINGVHHGNPDFGVRDEEGNSLYIDQCIEDMKAAPLSETQPYGVRSASTSEREQWPVYAANSLSELADLIGYEGQAKENWLRSIERYNQMCYQGHDDDYGKERRALIPIDEAPFYAGLNINRRMGVTSEPDKGFMCDGHLQIQNEDGAPIPGLYAAGICVGGRHAIYYPTPVAGNYIGMAMTHGRVLGKYLATL